MSLDFKDISADRQTVRVVEVGEDQVILADNLCWYDREQLEKALDAGMTEYKMPNTGITAEQYFRPFIQSESQISQILQYNRIRYDIPKAVMDIENTAAVPEAPVDETPATPDE